MKIIISGATGSLGRALITYFSGKGHDVIAVGRWAVPPAKLLQHAAYERADISQPFQLPDADVCIHAGGLSDDKGDWDNFYRANITGTKNMINAAKNCKTFIFISSSSVYLPSSSSLKESDVPAHDNKLLSNYGRSKIMAEDVLKKNNVFDSAFIIRTRALYGPGDIKIIPRMLRLMKKDVFMNPGGMQVKVSLTNYLNLCSAIESCMTSKRAGLNLYNVADPEIYILADAVKKVLSSLYNENYKEKKLPIWLIKLFGTMHLGGMSPLLVRTLTNDLVLDISKIKNEIGYETGINLYNSINNYAEWARSCGGADVLKTEAKNLAWK